MNAPIIIMNQRNHILTTIESYNEITVQITRAADTETKKYFYLVELTRRTWTQADPDDFCGHVHRAGIYRNKEAASNELLRLWHIRETEKAEIIIDPYFIFTFKEDAEPVHALEITNLCSAFI